MPEYFLYKDHLSLTNLRYFQTREYSNDRQL